MEIPFDWGGFWEGVKLVFNFFLMDVLLHPIGIAVLVVGIGFVVWRRKKK